MEKQNDRHEIVEVLLGNSCEHRLANLKGIAKIFSEDDKCCNFKVNIICKKETHEECNHFAVALGWYQCYWTDGEQRCLTLTKNEPDKNNNGRVYCNEHLAKAAEINKKRQLEYQEKIIKYCKNQIAYQKRRTFSLNYLVENDYAKENEIINSKSINIGYKLAYEFLIKDIKNGEIDA